MTPSELLTKAADLVRDTAAATTPGPWTTTRRYDRNGNHVQSTFVRPSPEPKGCVSERGVRPHESADYEWIALASPAVAPMWIYWLEHAQAVWEASERRALQFEDAPINSWVGELEQQALKLAELITGERAVLGAEPTNDQPPQVRACPTPKLAVMVDGVEVPIQPPDLLGLHSRVDLVVAETRPNRTGVRFVALMGVPGADPRPPTAVQSVSVWQAPLATVHLRRSQFVINECDIAAVLGVKEEQQ